MNANVPSPEARTLRELRGFLRVLAVALLFGTVAELLFSKHTDGPVQLIPFVLCGLGLLMMALVWRRPSPRTVGTLRTVMTVVALGSLLGSAQHLWGNFTFAQETRPAANLATLLGYALTGRDPLLAPGILATAAVCAIASTYAIDYGASQP